MPQEPDRDALEREHALELEISRLDYEASVKQAADRLRFQQETGLAAIKSMMLANGGAILALLTFIGNRPATYDLFALRYAFGLFCGGLFLALLSYLGAYFSQGWLSNYNTSVAWNYQDDMRGQLRRQDIKKERAHGTAFLASAVGCIVLSLVCFAFGAFAALNGIL